MFKCVVCEKKIAEKNRIFESLDWCPDCLKKDGNILARESKNINPSLVPDMPEPFKRYQSQRARYFVHRLPYYAQYENEENTELRLKISREVRGAGELLIKYAETGEAPEETKYEQMKIAFAKLTRK